MALHTCVSVVLALLSLRQALAESVAEERLIGWKGETWNSSSFQHIVSDDSEAKQPSVTRARAPWIETISWSPRAFIYHGLLSEAECDHLVKLGNQRVTRSSVVDAQTGATKLDDIRTSFGGSFARGEDPIIAAVEERIAEWTHIPPDHGEPMQILRYMNGQKYDAHWDWFSDPKYFGRGDNRLATVLMYLAEVEEGGETALPLAEAIDWDKQQIPNPSPCAAKMGIAVRPRKGDALLFFDMDVEGKGTKWTATKWLHNMRHMGSYDALTKAMACRDEMEQTACIRRARAGDCEKRADMIGPGGVCRKTCKDCVDCPQGDIICGRANMKGRLQVQQQRQQHQ